VLIPPHQQGLSPVGGQSVVRQPCYRTNRGQYKKWITVFAQELKFICSQ